jgi:hypothetical protein
VAAQGSVALSKQLAAQLLKGETLEYLKLAPDIDSDPDIEEAGWVAARVYELLLKVSAMKDLRGRIPPQFQHRGWLVKRWNLRHDTLPGIVPAEMLAAGVVRLLAVGLLAEDGEDWVITGWEKFYKPAKSGAERTNNWRARNKVTCDDGDEAASHVTGPKARDGGDECDATHVTPPTHALTSPTHDVRAPDPVSAMGAVVIPSVAQGAEPGRRADDAPRNVPGTPEKPTRPDEAWGAMDFWAWAQAKRHEAGLQPERRPNERTVSSWWSHAHMQGATPKALRRAFIAFGNDPYWTAKDKKPPVPFGGFVSQWERFMEPEDRHASG